MQLGYTDASGAYVPASSVQLRNKMRTADDEAVRRTFRLRTPLFDQCHANFFLLLDNFLHHLGT